MMKKFYFLKKTREIIADYLFNKKVRNKQYKVLGVTLIIAYLSCNNKAIQFHEKNGLYQKI